MVRWSRRTTSHPAGRWAEPSAQPPDGPSCGRALAAAAVSRVASVAAPQHRACWRHRVHSSLAAKVAVHPGRAVPQQSGRQAACRCAAALAAPAGLPGRTGALSSAARAGRSALHRCCRGVADQSRPATAAPSQGWPARGCPRPLRAGEAVERGTQVPALPGHQVLGPRPAAGGSAAERGLPARPPSLPAPLGGQAHLQEPSGDTVHGGPPVLLSVPSTPCPNACRCPDAPAEPLQARWPGTKLRPSPAGRALLALQVAPGRPVGRRHIAVGKPCRWLAGIHSFRSLT